MHYWLRMARSAKLTECIAFPLTSWLQHRSHIMFSPVPVRKCVPCMSSELIKPSVPDISSLFPSILQTNPIWAQFGDIRMQPETVEVYQCTRPLILKATRELNHSAFRLPHGFGQLSYASHVSHIIVDLAPAASHGGDLPCPPAGRHDTEGGSEALLCCMSEVEKIQI